MMHRLFVLAVLSLALPLSAAAGLIKISKITLSDGRVLKDVVFESYDDNTDTFLGKHSEGPLTIQRTDLPAGIGRIVSRELNAPYVPAPTAEKKAPEQPAKAPEPVKTQSLPQTVAISLDNPKEPETKNVIRFTKEVEAEMIAQNQDQRIAALREKLAQHYAQVLTPKADNLTKIHEVKFNPTTSIGRGQYRTDGALKITVSSLIRVQTRSERFELITDEKLGEVRVASFQILP